MKLMCLNQIINFVIHSEFLGSLVGILASALLLYLLGIRAYRRQKSLEECRKKYVEEGLEALYDEVAAAYASFYLNWQRALQLLRLMRDWDSQKFIADPNKIERGFISYSPKSLGIGCFYKVVELLRDDTLRKWSLDFFGEVSTQQTMYFEQEFRLDFESFLNTPNKDPDLCKRAYARHYEKLNQISEKIDKKFEFLEHYLAEIINIVRRKQISYETMSKLKDDQQIKNLLDAIRIEFQKTQDAEQKSSMS